MAERLARGLPKEMKQTHRHFDGLATLRHGLADSKCATLGQRGRLEEVQRLLR